MSSTRPLLADSLPSSSARDERYEDLLRKHEHLKDELADAQLKMQEARNQSAKALRAQARLRNQLEPLYNAIRGVMEELPEDEPVDPHLERSSSRNDVRWETWVTKLGGKQGEFIRAMIDHGAMTREQLKISTHSGSSTVDFVPRKLKELSLIEKNGGRYSLKQL